MGLNLEYEFLRSQILNREKVPSLEESIQIVVEEETRLKLVPGGDKEDIRVVLATKSKISSTGIDQKTGKQEELNQWKTV